MKLKRLERIIVESRDNGEQVSALPDKQQIFDKINEIIHYLHVLEKQKRVKPNYEHAWNDLRDKLIDEMSNNGLVDVSDLKIIMDEMLADYI